MSSLKSTCMFLVNPTTARVPHLYNPIPLDLDQYGRSAFSLLQSHQSEMKHVKLIPLNFEEFSLIVVMNQEGNPRHSNVNQCGLVNTRERHIQRPMPRNSHLWVSSATFPSLMSQTPISNLVVLLIYALESPRYRILDCLLICASNARNEVC